MKVMKEIITTVDGKDLHIKFGMPDTEEEKIAMFKLRYKIYSQRNYINSMEYPDKIEKDEFDDNNLSTYIIASIGDRVVGSLRLIHGEYLPTEKDAFEFKEPEALKEILRDRRVELGRLVVDRYSKNKFLPRHVVMLGLFYTATDYLEDKKIEGGYAFIKSSLEKKLVKLKFPLHIINPHKVIYSKKTLEGYFKDEKDTVVPIYFLRSEIQSYLKSIFFNKKYFKKESNNVFNYIFDKTYTFKLLRLFKLI